ncbi:MAG: RAMP superfamily CRISPR-associated protein [Nitrososphaerales archaeon]
MKVITITGRLKALTPVFHGGNEKTGSTLLLNRMRFIVNGKPTDIPVISGNSVRGRLRRLLGADFLKKAGYQLDLTNTKHQKLYHTIFSGGVLSSPTEESESGEIDLTLKNKIVSYILPIRLFGASYSNQMIEGRILVGHLLPICRELSSYIDVKTDISFYQLIGHVFQTRRDELRVKPPEEDKQAVQMLVEYEVFSAGTEFYHEIVLETTDEWYLLDLSTTTRALNLWAQSPYIGGKSAIGFGKLMIKYDLPQESSEEHYHTFIEKNRDKIHEALNELAEVL